MASPRMLALLGLLAVAGYQNRDKLGQILGQFSGSSPGGTGTGAGGLSGLANTLGGVAGNLGNLFGSGANSGGIGGALNDLIDHFSANGQGEAAESWVADGPNRQLGPNQMHEALGPDVLAELSQKTGLDKDEILRRLSDVLPQAVDQMTPTGQVPQTRVA